MVLAAEADGNRIAVHVDPAFPNAWREEPYYGALKQLARDAVDAEGQVVVYLKKRVIVVLPDQDVELGELAPGDSVRVGAGETSNGRVLEASKIPADEIPAPSSTENESTRSTVAGRSRLIGRAMAADARRTAVFHDLEQALDRLRATD
jgi:hypothetical protein